jgi:hypothetical protein
MEGKKIRKTITKKMNWREFGEMLKNTPGVVKAHLNGSDYIKFADGSIYAVRDGILRGIGKSGEVEVLNKGFEPELNFNGGIKCSRQEK